MTNPILGYDIDGQPLRAGDRVVIAGRDVYRCLGHVCTILGPEPNQQIYPGQIEAMDRDAGDGRAKPHI